MSVGCATVSSQRNHDSFGGLMNTATLNTNRSIHLIDLENLCGQSLVSPETAVAAREAYERIVVIGPNGQVVVATSRINAFAGFDAWSDARRMWRDGQDGADICLAQVIVDEHLHERFDHVYIASGDGGLADFVSFVRDHGTHTVVVSLEGHLAYRMSVAGDEVHTINPDTLQLAA